MGVLICERHLCKLQYFVFDAWLQFGLLSSRR